MNTIFFIPTSFFLPFMVCHHHSSLPTTGSQGGCSTFGPLYKHLLSPLSHPPPSIFSSWLRKWLYFLSCLGSVMLLSCQRIFFNPSSLCFLDLSYCKFTGLFLQCFLLFKASGPVNKFPHIILSKLPGETAVPVYKFRSQENVDSKTKHIRKIKF